MALLRRFWRDERGATGAVEFLLVFPVLIPMVALIVQFSLVFAAQLVVEGAAANAARAAVVWIPVNLHGEPRNVLGDTKRGHVDEAAALSCVAITPAEGSGPRVGGANLAAVDFDLAARVGGARDRTRVRLAGGHYSERGPVRVRVEHDFELRVPLAAKLLGAARGDGHVLTLRAECSLPNQGAYHGKGLL